MINNYSVPEPEPKMSFFINKDSSTPLYVQIMEQIKYMILTGELKPGCKLPSGRQLADFLHVNRATINNALNELEGQGYLHTEKGIGTYVNDHISLKVKRDQNKFREIIITAMEEAKKIGFAPDEFITAAFVLGEQEREQPNGSQEDFYAIFVECNEPVLHSYKRDIEESLSIKVETLLIDRLNEIDLTTLQLIKNAGMVITTFTHLHEVKSKLKDIDVEIIGVTAGPYLELLLRMSQMEKGVRIAVVMVSHRGAKEVAQSIIDSGINQSSIIVTSNDQEKSMIEAIKEAQLVIVSSAIVEKVKEYTNPNQEIMIYRNVLDSASKSMLKSVIADLQKNKRSSE
ncbi:MAG: hypothetical protein APF84_18865 [Gracilibacter sp. BRH_c7a]|nr:MAG: hypothetical protein APF84_18865 [Gracilibacter sp. BRH_c7a]